MDWGRRDTNVSCSTMKTVSSGKDSGILLWSLISQIYSFKSSRYYLSEPLGTQIMVDRHIFFVLFMATYMCKPTCLPRPIRHEG